LANRVHSHRGRKPSPLRLSKEKRAGAIGKGGRRKTDLEKKISTSIDPKGNRDRHSISTQGIVELSRGRRKGAGTAVEKRNFDSEERLPASKNARIGEPPKYKQGLLSLPEGKMQIIEATCPKRKQSP